MASYIAATARVLRRNETPAESIFWEQVRDRRFLNKKFSRQFPIPIHVDGLRRFFIADFFCHELQLIVEVDGSVHDEQKDYDNFRTELLNDLGYKVVRFSNDQVLEKLSETMKRLEYLILESPSLEERGNECQ